MAEQKPKTTGSKKPSKEKPEEPEKLKAKKVPSKKAPAKAGKRSAKALDEAKAKEEKEERKQSVQEEPAKKIKPAVKPSRPLIERRSKSYRQKHELIDKTKSYTLEEAAKLIRDTNPVKFDATVELHMRLNVDPRQADQNIRDSVLLPAGSGKTLRVAAFVEGDDVASANQAGADLVGEEAVIKELDAGSFSFDVLIATPSQMPKLGKYARLLGPRGLMPNPKSGSVTTDVAKAISEAKAGKVEYRVDSGGNLHIPVGKVSFAPEKLVENLNAAITSIQANKPASIKSTYILSSFLSTSMGPSIRLTL